MTVANPLIPFTYVLYDAFLRHGSRWPWQPLPRRWQEGPLEKLVTSIAD